MDTKRGRLSWGLLCLGAVACLVFLLLPTGTAGAVGYLVVAAVGVTMSILGAALMRGPRRRVWVALAAGQALYLAGDVLWVVYEEVLHIAPPPHLPTPST